MDAMGALLLIHSNFFIKSHFEVTSDQISNVRKPVLLSTDIFTGLIFTTGVAEVELGGGGQGGHGPPKNLSGWAKVCFGPPKILTPAPQNGPPVVKFFAKSLLSILKCAKFSKFSPAAGYYG